MTREEMESLCSIQGGEDPSRVESRMFDCAQELRSLANYEAARAILHSLRRDSGDSGMRLRAQQAWQDSMGYDITDAAGNTIQEGGGTLVWPGDWFRNFSDEEAAGCWIDPLAYSIGPIGAAYFVFHHSSIR
ncbi:hypothetical protein FBR05_09830 [Deltaproteobacteria bacterium PRO3]|nr:hypothetical protein [Deltaproteobacteria bacterium PRO3]